MNEIDLKTGQTRINYAKVFKKDGDTILGCYHNTRGLWAIAYHPGKNSLYVPFQDQCLSMTANLNTATGWGRRAGVMPPGSVPKTKLNWARFTWPPGKRGGTTSNPKRTAAPRS